MKKVRVLFAGLVMLVAMAGAVNLSPKPVVHAGPEIPPCIPGSGDPGCTF